jgi:type VI secretion system secreted protein VgrG
MLRSLRQGRRDGTFTHYQAELVPHLWLLTKRVQCRVFQELSVPDILKKVLDGLEVSWKLGGRYEPRNYTVQYRESDFAFASRLMEDEGIYYSFEHEGGTDRLVLADASPRSPELAAPNPVIYDETAGGVLPPARVTRWEKRQELRAGKYTLWDHSFQLPGQHLGATRTLPHQAAAGQVSHQLQLGGNRELEIFDYPGGYAHRFDGVARGGGDRRGDMHKVFEDNARTARIRMEEEAAPGLTAEGDSTCGHFLPGYRFGLERHYDGDGAYVLTQVEHKARIVGDYGRGEGLSLEYANRFACMPADVPYRPQRRTPRPTVPGPQTATVVGSPGSVSFNTQSYGPVGPAGDEIFCDKYGRVKVQFHWDRRSEYDEGSSCWLRVAQPWAGQQWGAVTLPRVGQEVVVAFEEGDPDRPLVMGSVYNAAQLPPFPLPAAKTQAGIKAHSQGSGANAQTFSGLGFETAMGQEHVHLHAERYMTHSAEQILYVNAGQEHQSTASKQPQATASEKEPSEPEPPPDEPSSPGSEEGPHGWNPNLSSSKWEAAPKGED